MIRTSSVVSWNEPLPSLTAKQLQAATESHDYARAHDLVLALETDDHLQYHYGVAADEQCRIPAVERSLADDHLPPLVLPPTKIDELWTVPRRVAGVLEAACRWLEDGELKSCEEAVVSGRSRKTARSKTERARTLKLERPLLLTDPDEDCDELQRMATVAVNCGEDCVRKHGMIRSCKEEQDLFAIPIDASIYAANLEESIRTETMVVSEHSIRSLISLMASMEWTDKDQAAFLDQQMTMPAPTHRYVSPPLAPVDDFDYFIPSGDVCLIPDASDMSSGVCEELQEAERLLSEQTGDVWKDEVVDLDRTPFSGYAFDDSMDDLCSQLPVLHVKRQLESDLSMSPSSISSGPTPQHTPTRRTEDDELFSSWINESILEGEDGKDDEASRSFDSNQHGAAQDDQHDLEDVDCPGANYEELTAESLLALEENEIVVQAKIPVPAVGVESSLPNWHNVCESSLDMLQWMMHDGKSAFQGLEWKFEYDNNRDCELEDNLDAMTAKYDQLCAETREVDEECFEKTALLFKTVPDIQSTMISSIKPMVFVHKVDDEGPLEIPEDVPKEPPVPNEAAVSEEAAVNASKSAREESSKPQNDSNKGLTKGKLKPQKDISNPWGDLMNRHKKRKVGHKSNSPMPNSIDITASQEAVEIKAPELLLGFRAFAHSSTDVDEQDNSQVATLYAPVHPPPITTQAATVVVERGTEIRPLVVATSDLPKAILSIAIPRALRTVLVKLLPSLQFVERDYQQHHAGYDGINTSDEADVVVSPSTGVILATMVALRQTDTQKRLVFQGRVATVAPKYQMLHILIYRNNARPVRDGGAHDDLPELSPSDAMALAQLQGFVCSLPCKVSASYVGGGVQAVAEWVASLVVQTAKKDGKRQIAEKYLVEEETRWEIFLRQAGFNVYDAQIVLGVLREASSTNRWAGDDGRDCIRQLIKMSPDERLRRFGSVVGCQNALATINNVFAERALTGSAPFFK